MRRVLLVGPMGVGQMAWFIRPALERDGCTVIPFDDRRFLGSNGTRLGHVFQVAQTRSHRGPLFARLQRSLVEAARGVDLVLTVKGENIVAETVRAISKLAPSVNWYSDHPFLEQNYEAISEYTLFCPKDSWTADRLRSAGFSTNVKVLPHASDPDLMTSHASASFDIGITGSMYPYREIHVQNLLAAGFTMQIFGGRVRGRHEGVAQRTKPVFGAAYADAMAGSRVVLNTHVPLDIVGANQRLFDAAAAGRPQLTELLEDSMAHFDASQVAFFSSQEQMIDLAEALISDPTRRESMGKAALERVRAEHTYDHRIATIREWLA